MIALGYPPPQAAFNAGSDRRQRAGAWSLDTSPLWYRELVCQVAEATTRWRQHDPEPDYDPRRDPRTGCRRATVPELVRQDVLEVCRRLRRMSPARWSNERLAELLGVDAVAITNVVSEEHAHA